MAVPQGRLGQVWQDGASSAADVNVGELERAIAALTPDIESYKLNNFGPEGYPSSKKRKWFNKSSQPYSLVRYRDERVTSTLTLQKTALLSGDGLTEFFTS